MFLHFQTFSYPFPTCFHICLLLVHTFSYGLLLPTFSNLFFKPFSYFSNFSYLFLRARFFLVCPINFSNLFPHVLIIVNIFMFFQLLLTTCSYFLTHFRCFSYVSQLYRKTAAKCSKQVAKPLQ